MHTLRDKRKNVRVLSLSRSSSLGRRMVLATLVFSFLFTLGIVLFRALSAWQSNLATMTSELNLINQVFQQTLSKAAWEMDNEALRTQLESAAQAAPVGRITLTIRRAGRTPEILEHNRGQNTVSELTPKLHRMLIVEPYPGAKEIVGELTIEGDENVLWSRLLKELTSIGISQVIQSLMLAGLIMHLFNREVTVHVQRIALHLSQLLPSNVLQTIQLNRPASYNDELSLLEAGVNDLQRNLASYLERQHQDELALAASRDQLVYLVAERTAELQAANTRLEELSRNDPLTGLANRRHFDEVKEIEFYRALRHNQTLSVLMCDVDFFKRYNDLYGHAMGDQCLQVIAELLKSSFKRAGELPARIGGEEFVVLLPGADISQARNAANKLVRALVNRALPHDASSISSYVTLSIGVAQFDSDTMDSFNLLLQRADQALYRAKNLGRNQVSE